MNFQANRPRAISRVLPAPVGGWNRRDSLDAMKPEDAVILENWFPRQSDVIVRGGFDVHCNTAEGTTIGTLAEWKSRTDRKLLAAVNGKLINATTGTPSTIGTGFTSNRWRWVNFSNKLFLVNGFDAPRDWDGTTLTATAWSGSGLTVADLSDVCVFKERLFFIEKNSLSFWYGGLKAVTGTLTEFPLQYIGQFGGTLQAIGTISSDGGDQNGDDLLCLYFSSGEVVVYQGSDPGDATSWLLVGRYDIGAPIGAALAEYGSDLVAITEGAYVPMTKVIPFGRSQPSALDLSDRISGEVSQVTQSYGSNTGWQIILYPRGRKLIFNVPRSATFYDQHVMNLDTKRWCKFTGWNFQCFTLFNNQLYGGGTNGKVYRVDYGLNDDGTEITADGQTAWNYFGLPGYEKNFSMIRVNLKAVSDPGATMSIGTDFDISVPSETVEVEDVESGGIWDQAIWDQAIWGGTQQALKGWQGIAGQGYCASMRLRVAVDAQSVGWQSGNIVFTAGAIV